jgi:hypothetical protein
VVVVAGELEGVLDSKVDEAMGREEAVLLLRHSSRSKEGRPYVSAVSVTELLGALSAM